MATKSVEVATVHLLVFAGLWVSLLVVHYVLVFVFAGWLGTADDFVTWSIAALLLWTWTRRRCGFRPLTASGWRRLALALWLLTIGIAMAGVDEGRVPGIPAIPAAIAYFFLPLLITVPIATVLVVKAIRFIRRPDPGVTSSETPGIT